jgi:hypothetical protein
LQRIIVLRIEKSLPNNMRKFAQNKTYVESHVLPRLWSKKKRGGWGEMKVVFASI